jgi:ferrous iron transport protein B
MNLSIALAGNPNSGKSTIFNAVTGARQHVANYPGVTVEKREGRRRHAGHDLTVVDLPGTYSLTAYSTEELIARNYVLEEKPDAVIHIVDASNLERNLYLAVQFLEIDAPLVLAFNMSDVVEARGERIDVARLSQLLGVPIVPTVGNKRTGIEELLDAAVAVATSSERRRPAAIRFGREIEEELAGLQKIIGERGIALSGVSARWIALKLIENDPDVRAAVGDDELIAAAERSRKHLRGIFGDAPEIVISERRYGFISGACQEAMVTGTVEFRHTVSDRIDAVMTHPVIGMAIFLALMYLVFQFTFTAGEPGVRLVEFLVSRLGTALDGLLSPGLLRSVLVDGVVAGVGGVLTFLPNILMLFLAIAFLEDSGYMARAAFVMDHLMHRIGLHGKSFIPMLLGFGCSVPAIMATRMLEDRRDRIATILVIPLMSCSARLPVYTLLAGAFFTPRAAGKVIFSIYTIGLLLAFAFARLFRRYVVPGPVTPFVIELPPYRVPTARGALIHTWERGSMFVRKAGTVILAASVIIWALSRFPTPTTSSPGVASAPSTSAAQLGDSYAGRIGKALAPMLRPVGLGDWKLATALLFGVSAKEVVVSTLGTLYSLDTEEKNVDALREALHRDPHLSRLKAYSMMLFVLIYVPCIPTIAVVARESGHWLWALFHVGYTTLLAWIASFIVYQGGCLLGLA